MITIIVNINIIHDLPYVKSIILFFFIPLLPQDIKRNDAINIVPFCKPYFLLTLLLFNLRSKRYCQENQTTFPSSSSGSCFSGLTAKYR